MDDRVVGATGSAASGRRRRRLRLAILRGYPKQALQAFALATGLWLLGWAPALADSGSRYSAPLWSWIAAIVIALALSLVGLLIGRWFLRKRARLDEHSSPD